MKWNSFFQMGGEAETRTWIYFIRMTVSTLTLVLALTLFVSASHWGPCTVQPRAHVEESLMRDHPLQEGRAGLLLWLPFQEGAQVLRGVLGSVFFICWVGWSSVSGFIPFA